MANRRSKVHAVRLAAVTLPDVRNDNNLLLRFEERS